MTGQELQDQIKTILRAPRNTILSLIAVTCGSAAWTMYMHGSVPYLVAAAVCALVTCFAVLWLAIRIARTSFGQTPAEGIVTAIAARGLAPYNDQDASLFWQLGRKPDIRRLIGAIHDTNNSVILLHGMDGSGKTSALWAGLKPQLGNGIRCVYCDAAVDDPVMAASKAIQREPDLDVGRNLVEILDDHIRTVLIIDSLEQLDLTSPEHSPFLALLQALHNQSPPYRIQVVGAIRDSYLATWNAIEAQTGLRAVRLPLSLLTVDIAFRNLERILEESDIKIDRAVIRDFLRTISNDNDHVLPIDIAVASRVFAEWAAEHSGQYLRSAAYASEGGSVAVWRRHIEGYLRSYIPESDKKAAINALVNQLTNFDSGASSLPWASALSLAAGSQITAHAWERYLSDMASRSVRILEVGAGQNFQYRLARESFVIALKQLQQELIAPSDHTHLFLVERLHAWKRSNEGRDLLSGELLKLAVTHEKTKTVNRELSDYIDKSRTAQRRKRLGTGVMITVGVCLIAFGWWSAQGYLRKTTLTNWLLPRDLYDRQEQFKVLTIRGYSITNLDWLKYANFRKLEISEARLTSLAGIKNLRSADNVTLDLSHTNIGSLKDIADVPGLTTLSLSLGHSQVTTLAELEGASKLTSLSLDLGGSSIKDIAALAKVKGLRRLTLNLPGSPVQDLSALSSLNNLETVTLELEGPQVGMIADVTRSASIHDLTLIIENPRNLHGPPVTRSIPSLSSMQNLKKLAIILKPGSTLDSSAASIYPPVASLGTLRLPEEIRDLSIDLGGFSVTTLPRIEDLKQLTKLSLHEQGSGLARLPALPHSATLEQIDLSVDAQLASTIRLASDTDLQSLSLEINGPKFKTLPRLSGLDGLRALTLDVSQTAITDFRQLSSFGNLRELELHVSGAQAANLPPLTSLQQLRSIALYLTGEVRGLPSFALNHDLSSLTLGLSGSSLEQLPSLSQFKNVQTLSLFLAGSQVRTIDSVPQAATLKSMFLDVSDTPKLQSISLSQFRELTDLTIALHGSAIQSIPDVTSLTKLKNITLDVRNSAFTDFSRVHGFRAIRELTVDQSCSSLSNVPPDAERIAFLWTTR